MAEKLADRIEECNKDLTEMIEEINTVSSMLSNASGGDDPVCFNCSEVLNTKLTLLVVTCCACTQLTSFSTSTYRYGCDKASITSTRSSKTASSIR
jgi:hypothetical protein